MIILSHDQHLDEIAQQPMSQRERLAELDQRILDILYDDELRRIARTMSEPDSDPPIERKRSHMLGAIALNCMLWIPLIVLAVEFFRP